MQNIENFKKLLPTLPLTLVEKTNIEHILDTLATSTDADNVNVLEQLDSSLPQILTYRQILAFCYKLTSIQQNEKGQYPTDLANQVQSCIDFVNTRINNIQATIIDTQALTASIERTEKIYPSPKSRYTS
ncbi:MAG: hypothetical protein ACK4PR_09315, partial [Gammaproteobacteria bacterium]